MRRIMASHPDYKEVNFLQTMYCIGVNKRCHYDASRREYQSEIDERVVLADISGWIGELLEGGVFKDFINAGS